MANKSKIEWIDSTLNPIRARNRETGKVGWHCEHVSPGCVNCYAEKQNKSGFAGGTKLAYKPGHRQDVEIFLDEATLTQPIRWGRQRSIFMCSMTDAFAEFVPDDWLDRMVAMAALVPHTVIFLTKRSGRMRGYFSQDTAPGRQFGYIGDLARTTKLSPYTMRGAFEKICKPLPNVVLGVTAEDQERADERREDLRALSARGWRTFVSYEPAVGPIDWKGWEFTNGIISGGESGPRARPAHPDWHRATRDFCAAHGIAYEFKQWGEFVSVSEAPGTGLHHYFDDGATVRRVGTKAAGRTHDDLPWRVA